MIYTPLVSKALQIAYTAHHGQSDYSGVPYIFHPYAVAELVCETMPEEAAVCAALLHDVVEDTSVTWEDLEAEFPEEVIELLKILTHDPEEDYFAYIRRIKQNPVATQIKGMDVWHNMAESRLTGCDNVTEEQRAYWEQKYSKALGILLGSDSEEELEVQEAEVIDIVPKLENADIQTNLEESGDGDWLDSFLEPMNEKQREEYERLKDKEDLEKLQLGNEEKSESVFERLDGMRREILPHSKEVVREHRFEIFAVIERILQVEEIARVQGLDPFLAEGERLAAGENEWERFLARGLNAKVVADDVAVILEMIDIYEGSERNAVNDLRMYLCIRGAISILRGESALVIKDILLSCIPYEERKYFEKYHVKEV